MSAAAGGQEAGARRLAEQIARCADEKKASEIVAIDLRGIVSYTDWFLLCTGNTERQTKAIHDAVAEGMRRELGVRPRRVEGLGQARWILMDYIDVVVHIFTPATRSFYRLESLWGEAPLEAMGPPEPALAGERAEVGA